MKKYSVKFDDYRDPKIYSEDEFEEMIDAVTDPERYKDENYDAILESIDENNGGFEFNGAYWSASELLKMIDEDMLYEYVDGEAEYYASDLRGGIRSHIEDLEDVGDSEDVDDFGVVVTLIENDETTEEEEPEMAQLTLLSILNPVVM